MPETTKPTEVRMNTEELSARAGELTAGQRILLSGTAYTARDAAHIRIMEALDGNGELPFPLKGAVIYYSGPTPTPPGMAIGAAGPTTSSRLDRFTPTLMDHGLIATIGKGQRSKDVVDAIKKHGGVYFAALGGAAALAAASITQCDVIAYEDLGTESVKRIVLKDFPLIVAIDSKGNVLFK